MASWLSHCAYDNWQPKVKKMGILRNALLLHFELNYFTGVNRLTPPTEFLHTSKNEVKVIPSLPAQSWKSTVCSAHSSLTIMTSSKISIWPVAAMYSECKKPHEGTWWRCKIFTSYRTLNSQFKLTWNGPVIKQKSLLHRHHFVSYGFSYWF